MIGPDLGTMIAELLRGVVREELDRAICELSPSEQPPALLDKQQLAKELSTSISTIDRLIKRGMPFVMLVEAKRFELPAVLEWLRSQRGDR